MRRKKASVRFLSAVLAFLLLCTVAACAPSTDDASPSTEAYIPTVPKAPTTPKAPTEAPTEEATAGTGGNDVIDGVLLEEDFEDLNGWENLPAKGIPEGATAGIKDGALSVTVPTTMKTLVAKTHELYYSGKIAIELDMAVTFPEGAVNSKAGGALIVYTDDNKPAICLYFLNGKMGYFDVDKTTGASVNKFAGYVSGTTCRVKIVADIETDTYAVYINGTLSAGGIKFRNNGENFTMIQLGSGGNDVGATAIFDNLKVSVTDESVEGPVDNPTETPTDPPSGGGTSADPLRYENAFDADLDTSKWGINPDATSATADRYVKVKDGKLEMKPKSGSTLALLHGITVSDGKFVFEVDVESDKYSTNYGVFIQLGNNADKVSDVAYVKIFQNKVEYSSTGNASMKFAANSVYRVKLIVDMNAQTYNVYIDDQVVAENVAFKAAVTSLDRIRFTTTVAKVDSTVKFDNLKIYATEE